MKRNHHLFGSIGILSVLCLIVGLVLHNSGVASGYPPPSTPTSPPVGSQSIVPRAYLPLVLKDFPPLPSPSYYVANLSTLYNLGYTLGQQDYNTPGTQDRLVVLDFGYPVYSSTISTYGTYLPFDTKKIFRPTADIAVSVKEFARGYWYGTSSDTSSHLRVVVGTNNCCNGVALSVFQGHGTAWAQMMNTITSTITTYARQVDVVAGSDMEMEFNDPYATAQWAINLANATAGCNPDAGGVNGCLYNFGNNTVTPNDPAPCATSRSASWHACDVWLISWGLTKSGSSIPFARPLPEIYHTADSKPPYGTDATAWKDLAFYSVSASYNTRRFGSMYFVGSLTQFARCGAICYDAQGRPYANNTAQQGYLLLYNALNSTATTRQTLRWSTDITTQQP